MKNIIFMQDIDTNRKKNIRGFKNYEANNATGIGAFQETYNKLYKEGKL